MLLLDWFFDLFTTAATNGGKIIVVDIEGI